MLSGRRHGGRNVNFGELKARLPQFDGFGRVRRSHGDRRRAGGTGRRAVHGHRCGALLGPLGRSRPPRSTGAPRRGGEVVVAVTADVCRTVDGMLLSEDQSFDTLGRAVWRMPGPPIDGLVITIGRSADRALGDQPRSLPLTSQQATERWGIHPVVPAAQEQRDLVRLAGNFGLIAAALIALVLGVGLFVAFVGCVRRGEIVLIWFLR